MIRMMTKRPPESKPHDLSLAEIRTKERSLTAMDLALAEEDGRIYRARQAGAPPPPLYTDHDRAIREIAAELMNGAAPADILLPPAVSREDQIHRQRGAIKMALSRFAKLAEDAAWNEAEGWVEANAREWAALCAQIVLCATRLAALEEKARTVLEDGTRGQNVRGLAMVQHIGSGQSLLGVGDPLREMREAALAENVVTKSEIKGAENVG